MDLLDGDLSKPADSLFIYNLAAPMESAVRGTNAQFDEADILKRLDCRLLETCAGETGWDVFSLDYHVDGPISTIFMPDCMMLYLRAFSFLWRVKRMEHTLASIWKAQITWARKLSRFPFATAVMHQFHIMSTEMAHVTKQVQYYLNFEVLECSWDELVRHVSDANDLDSIISAHKQFLDKIIARSLLGSDTTKIYRQLRQVFDLVGNFREIESDFLTSAGELLQLEDSLRQACADSDSDTETEVQNAHESFDQKCKEFQLKLNVLAKTYNSLIVSLLLLLDEQKDESLKFLGFRLNFNRNYLKKYPRRTGKRLAARGSSRGSKQEQVVSSRGQDSEEH